MTKEEIQAQINIYSYLIINSDENNIFKHKQVVKYLENKLQSAKSIKDIEREAFEAGKFQYELCSYEDYKNAKQNGLAKES